MAPKFEDYTIAFSGTCPGHTQSELSIKIKNLDGKVSPKITDSCNFLVASQKDWDAKSAKVKQAIQLPAIKIVSFKWLLDSLELEEIVEEDDYLMEPPKSKDSGGDTKPKKRGRKQNGKKEDDSQQDEAEPPAKKKKDQGDSQKARDSEEPPLKKENDGKKLKSTAVQVPVDAMCPLKGSCQVYVAFENTVYDASLNQTNSGYNNNKFYLIQVLDDAGKFYTWTRWGRVGEGGQNAMLGDGSIEDALKQFYKKFKDKTGLAWEKRLEQPKGGKYTFIERSYEPDSEEDHDGQPGAGARRASKESLKSESSVKKAESQLPKPLQNLMELIFDQSLFQAAMADMSYDAKKMPLGKLSKRTLMQGYEKLKELSDIIYDPEIVGGQQSAEYREALERISNAYYTYIPHDFRRNRPPIINGPEMLKKEVNLLESLTDMSIAEEIIKSSKSSAGDTVHHLDRQFAGLMLEEMTALEHQSEEFVRLNEYLLTSRGQTHNLRMEVQEIFRIKRSGESDRFLNSVYAQLQGTQSDRRLLWHGSRCTNFGGILSQGLRIAPPEAPVNGYMFGKGVYLADMSTKSANYCVASSSGNIGLLLLCEAELGKPMYELTDSEYQAEENSKEKGCHATWGKGMTGPATWIDAGFLDESLRGVCMPDLSKKPGPTSVQNAMLLYNEYICYDVAQIRLRYLFRVKMH